MREKIDQTERNQQLTEEELQRTQVLNLADFKETARIEKLTSKKPAIIVAIIGFLSISLGTIIPAVQSIQARKEQQNISVVSARKEPVLKSKEENVTCTKKELNMSNGTDQIFEINYTFENNELVKAQKTFSMTATNNSANGKKTVDWYSNAIVEFFTEKSGYTTSVKNIDKGVMSVIDINYELLDVKTIPQANQANYIYKSDFNGKESKSTVITKTEAMGLKCSGDIEETPKETTKTQTTKKVKTETLNCVFKDENRSDGTSYNYETTYTFENNKLVTAKKSFTMTPVAGSTNGVSATNVFKNILQAEYIHDLTGYKSRTEVSGQAVTTIIDIDYKTVQLDSIPEPNKSNYIHKSDFTANDTKETVSEGSKKLGFTCK